MTSWPSLLGEVVVVAERPSALDLNDSDAIHDNIDAEISAITEKAVLVDADLALIEDSAASNAKKRVQIGNLLGAWAAWTPTYANLTIGNGTVVARYVQIGKTVHAYFEFTLGSTSSVDGLGVTVSTPVTASSNYAAGKHTVGTGYLFDATGGGLDYQGSVRLASTTTFEVQCYRDAGGGYILASGITATVPFTWTTSDVISVTATYEAA